MSTPCKLISFSGSFPPGGYPYEQTVKGVTYKFPDIGLDITSQSQKISSFRKQNGFPRATLEETVEDVNLFTCLRLGCDPRFCSDGVTKQATVQKVERRGCSSCGAVI